MMMAGIKILFCLGFALGTGHVVSDPNQADHSITHSSQTIRQQIERQRMSAWSRSADSFRRLKQMVTNLGLQLSTDSTLPSLPGGGKKKAETRRPLPGGCICRRQPEEKNRRRAGSQSER
jgi:hypothetical protein